MLFEMGRSGKASLISDIGTEPAGSEGGNMGLSKETLIGPGRETVMCKGPELGAGWTCWR